jgi:hydroxyacylglutathione hydrolase
MRIEGKRAKGQPTVPSLLSEELATNPFLRASDARIRAQLNMTDASDREVFAEIRSRKDNF